MAQFARPNSDITLGSWQDDGGGTTNIYLTLDESSASDADFVTGDNNTNDSYEAGLSNVTDPVSSTGHSIRYRYRKDASGGRTRNIEVGLYQGGTLIASQTHNDIGNTWTAGSFSLTGGQADGITDYTDLRLRFTASGQTGGNPGNRRSVQVSWAELETPDAAPETPVAVDGTSAVISAWSHAFVVVPTPQYNRKPPWRFAGLDWQNKWHRESLLLALPFDEEKSLVLRDLAGRRRGELRHQKAARGSFNGQTGTNYPRGPGYSDGITWATINSSYTEVSGIACSRRNPGIRWIAEDSGNGDVVYAIDNTGNVVRQYNLPVGANVDIEDLFVGQGPTAGEWYLYVADIGDNPGNRDGTTRTRARVFRAVEPTVTAGSPLTLSIDATVTILYPLLSGSAQYNAESFFIDPLDKHWYVLSKESVLQQLPHHQSNSTKVFKIDASDVTGTGTYSVNASQVLTLDATVDINDNGVAAASISDDGRAIAFRDSNDNQGAADPDFQHKIQLWLNRKESESVETALARNPDTVQLVGEASESKGEALDFLPFHGHYAMCSTGEATSAPIYDYIPGTPWDDDPAYGGFVHFNGNPDGVLDTSGDANNASFEGDWCDLDSDIPAQAGDFTVVALVRCEVFDKETIVGGTNDNYIRINTATQFRVKIANVSSDIDLTGGPTLSFNTWHVVHVRRSGTTIEVGVDGQWSTTTGSSSATLGSLGSVAMKAPGTEIGVELNYFGPGDMGMVCFWSEALTDTDIVELAADPFAPFRVSESSREYKLWHAVTEVATPVAIDGTSSLVSAWSADVVEGIELAGTSSVSSLWSADVLERLVLVGTAAISSNWSADVLEDMFVAGNAAIASTWSADVSEVYGVDGTTAITSVWTAEHLEGIALDGASSLTSTWTADVLEDLLLTGTAAVVAVWSADVLEDLFVDGTAVVNSAWTADVTEALDLDGTVAVSSNWSADVAEVYSLDGTLDLVGQWSSDLLETFSLDGTTALLSLWSADVVEALDLAGTASIVSDWQDQSTETPVPIDGACAIGSLWSADLVEVFLLSGSVQIASNLSADVSEVYLVAGTASVVSQWSADHLELLPLAGTVTVDSVWDASITEFLGLVGTSSIFSLWQDQSTETPVAIDGNCAITASWSANVVEIFPLLGSASLNSNWSASVVEDLFIDGTASLATNWSADVLEQRSLSGSTALNSLWTAAVTEEVNVAGAVSLGSQWSAQLAEDFYLAGTSTIASDWSASATVSVNVAGTVGIGTTWSANLVEAFLLDGSTIMSSTWSAEHLELIRLHGTSSMVSGWMADVLEPLSLTGAAGVGSSWSASVLEAVPLSGVSNWHSDWSADALEVIVLDGTTAVVSTWLADVVETFPLDGLVAVTSDWSADALELIDLQGTLAIASNWSGEGIVVLPDVITAVNLSFSSPAAVSVAITKPEAVRVELIK